jgi:lipid-A-disaccharide synthase
MKLLVSALEPSSNIHLREVLRYGKDIELIGIFDSTLGNPLYDTNSMAVMGFIDVIKKLRWFFIAIEEMVELAENADKILLMDSSAFNIPLSKRIKERYPKKEIIYYILPQVWASRPSRVKKLESYCDTLLGILPFEIDYYSKAQYVGHPLLDEIRVVREERPKYIAFLAGSRGSEIKKLMPIFREVQKEIDKEAILVIPPNFSDDKIEALYGDISNFKISRDTHKALANSEFAFICSGTATLESALIGTPFLLVYIAKAIDFFIGKRVLNIKYVGLANILLQHYNSSTLHKELLQDDVNVENLLREYRDSNKALFMQKAIELRGYLKSGSSKRVAQIVSS